MVIPEFTRGSAEVNAVLIENPEAQGAIIGKAMSTLESGKGMVLGAGELAIVDCNHSYKARPFMKGILPILSRGDSGKCHWWAISLALLVLLATDSTAKELAESEVKAAVQTWVRSLTTDAKPDAVIEKMEARIVNGHKVAYIAHLAGGGFCLCGADDLVLPVYLYNPKGSYDPAIPDLGIVLDEIASRLSAVTGVVKQQGSALVSMQPFLSERAAYWADLIAGRTPTRTKSAAPQTSSPGSAGPATLQLPLTCQWHQGSPYNDQCPPLVPGQDATRCVAGCVPISIAQIMYYWKWPSTGNGSRSDVGYGRRSSSDWVEEPLATDPGIPTNWSQDLGQGTILEWNSTAGGKLRMRGYWDHSLAGDVYWSISKNTDFYNAVWLLFTNRLSDVADTFPINFAATTYRWDLLQDVHTDPPDATDAEVAKVCFHAGVACGINWGVRETNGGGVAAALKTYFRYDSDAVSQGVVVHADAIGNITEDLQWCRPVSLGGCAHQWVTYGYNKDTDPNRRFLMNMGWGPGFDHIWYTFDEGTPGDVWCNNITSYDFRIAPANTVRFVGAAAAGDGSPGNPHKDIQEALGAAPDGATLIFKADSVNTFPSATLTISRPLTLKGVNAMVRKQ